MAEIICSLQFDSSGCTNKLVKNMGGVDFSQPSILGNKSLKCATFQSWEEEPRLQCHSPSVDLIIKNKSPWSLYFLFNFPKGSSGNILDYEIDGKLSSILYVDQGRFFIQPNRHTKFFTNSIDYVCDGKFHNFYMSWDEEHTLRVYIDGHMMLRIFEADPFTFSDLFYFNGLSEGSKMDDINFFSGLLFRDEFVPPTDYVTSHNSITNYYGNNDLIRSNMEKETIDSVERNREHTLYTLRTRQKGTLPKRARFNWHEETHGFFHNQSWDYIRKSDYGTYINVDGVEQPFLTNVVPCYEANMNIAFDTGQILPMMIFVNGTFRRLSQIDIIKSDDYYCFHIKDRDRFTEDPVTSFEIIVIPFPIVYEEDYGERSDLTPLYVFNREGKFDPAHGHTYYYIDESRDPNTKQIGIREMSESPLEDEKVINTMNMLYRYGTLELYRMADDGKGAFMRFQSEDYSWISPTSVVNLYNGVVHINPAMYTVIGYDLIYFHNIALCGIRPGRTVTMQIVTNSRDAMNEMLFQDVTDIQMVSVRASVQDQSVIPIPEIDDGDGVPWSNFLIFRGLLCMNYENYYMIDHDNGTINILDRENYLDKGEMLIFVFIKVRRSGAGGPYIPDPVYLYMKPESEYKARIPEVKGIEVTKEKVILFRNGTMVNANRYTIQDGYIVLNPDEPPMDFLDGKTTLMIVMIKLLPSDRDPRSWRVNLIKNEWIKGNRFVLYDLSVAKRIKLTLDNLVCFDQNGELVTDLRGQIYNMNVVKRLYTMQPLDRQVRYLTCVYRNDALENGSHVTKFPLNDGFLKDYIMAKREYYELDGRFDEFLANFNFKHRNDIGYGENLRNSLASITSYDPNKLDEVYDSRATAERRQYDPVRLNNCMVADGTGYKFTVPPREVYSSPAFVTREIFFQDGIHAEWNKDTYHTATDDLVVPVPSKFPNGSKLESITFKGMCNDLIPLSGIPTSSKSANVSIPSTLVTGEWYEHNIPGTITITENYYKSFSAMIEVPRWHEYLDAMNEYEGKQFSASLTVQNSFDKDILFCSLNVFRYPDGIPVDPNGYDMYLDFKARIIVE